MMGRGYQYYTTVIYPYERNDGKLWLLMGMSEGILQLDSGSSLEETPRALASQLGSITSDDPVFHATLKLMGRVLT